MSRAGWNYIGSLGVLVLSSALLLAAQRYGGGGLLLCFVCTLSGSFAMHARATALRMGIAERRALRKAWMRGGE